MAELNTHHKVEMTTQVMDIHDPNTPELKVSIESDGVQIAIRPHGYGENGMEDGHGFPVLIEQYQGRLWLRVWADINQDDPTHSIDLTGALEAKRK